MQQEVEKSNYSKFEKVLQNTYSKSAKISVVQQAPDGRNAKGHWVASTQNFDYGFKTYPMAKSEEEIFAEQDYLVAQIAQRLRIPFASHIKQSKDLDYENCLGKTVNISRWLKDGEPLDKITAVKLATFNQPATRNGILKAVGRWIAFGTCLGIQDRDVRQFIYRQDSPALLMIDLDYAFEKFKSDDTKYGGYARVLDRFQFDSNRDDFHSLKQGIDEVHENLKIHENCIISLLEKAKHSKRAQQFKLAIDSNLYTNFFQFVESSKPQTGETPVRK